MASERETNAGVPLIGYGLLRMRNARVSITALSQQFPRLPFSRRATGRRCDGRRCFVASKRDSNTSPAHLNYLTIVASDGVSGLRKALKDPNQLLPVLAVLGMGSTLVSRQSELEPDEQ